MNQESILYLVQRMFWVGTVVLMVAVCGGIPAIGSERDTAIESAIAKDCNAFCDYSKIKYEKIQSYLRRGMQQEARRVVKELQIEESRFLERLSWYLGEKGIGGSPLASRFGNLSDVVGA